MSVAASVAERVEGSRAQWWRRREALEIRADAPGVTAVVPCYGANSFVRQAIQSVLAQSYRRITVIVMSDGDPNPPWDALASVRDARVVRFALERNRGPYFAHAVALEATSDPFYLIQDADDWSHPERVSVLLDDLQTTGASASFSDVVMYRSRSDRTASASHLRWSSDVRLSLTPKYLHRAPHHGLMRTSALRHVGGYYGGFRIGYDTFLMNLMLMAGSVSYVPLPLYNYRTNPGSLTQAPATGFRSEYRQAVRALLASLYEEAYGMHEHFLAGRINAAMFASAIRAIAGRYVSTDDRAALRRESGRLRRQLEARTSCRVSKATH